MPSTVLVGAQWGDEGKGKICDLVAGDFDAVVRYSGGNNAGHTIVVNGKKYGLHPIFFCFVDCDNIKIFVPADMIPVCMCCYGCNWK